MAIGGIVNPNPNLHLAQSLYISRLATNNTNHLKRLSKNLRVIYSKLYNTGISYLSIHIQQLSIEPIATMPSKQSSFLRKPGVKSLSPLILTLLPNPIAQSISPANPNTHPYVRLINRGVQKPSKVTWGSVKRARANTHLASWPLPPSKHRRARAITPRLQWPHGL